MDESKEPDIYEMQVNIFGAKPSPASAIIVLQKRVVDHGDAIGLQKKTCRLYEDSFLHERLLALEKA